MTPEELQRRLRRLPLGGSLVVKRDRTWATRHGRHPDAFQVWDFGHTSGRPECILSIERDGLPIELSEAVVARLARAQLFHNGRASAVDEQVDEYEREERENDLARHRILDEGREERRDRVYHGLGKLRYWGVNKAKLPCASPKSSPQSVTA